jgi:hypothetical protein
MEKSPSGELTVTLTPKKFLVFHEAQHFIGSEDLTAVATKSMLFWVVMPYTSEETWHFSGASIFRAEG